MCGIAGIIGLAGAPVDPGALDRMTDALSMRGPDGRGTFIHQNVGLGHRRLSIIDLTDAASQPMVSEDGNLAITFNGEIYNFAEERVRLESKGAHFHSRSDTEMLLKLYEESGSACVDRLRGMFAFAILDRKRNIVFLARDRLGKKPILYFRTKDTFAFASSVDALRTLPDCPREIDHEVVHHFLTMMYVPSPATGFVGVSKLPAAHTLTLDLTTGKEVIARYWELNYKTDTTTSLSDWKAKIDALMEESVKLRMVADVPVGAFLSGGLDSATVVSYMSRLSPKPVQTFSIGSEDEDFNELPQAALIAKTFGTDHHPIILKADIVHLLPELVAAYGEPFADPSSIPSYLVARETRKNVTVALNGDGGDENFAGYVRYPIVLFSEKWHRMPGVLHSLLRPCVAGFHALRGDTFSYRCKRFEDTINLPMEKRYIQYLSFFTENEKRSIYASGFASTFPRTEDMYASLTEPARHRATDSLHRAMSMDVDSYLADDLLPKVDRATMAHGLEARSPLLDHRLLEFTAQLPAQFQIQGGTKKWILREIMKDRLPAEILAKRKTGFRLPLDRWFRTDLKSFVRDTLLSAPPSFFEIFDRDRLTSFLDAYDRGHIDYSDHVWALLWLSAWLRMYAS
jgi:asparagine synthase (glutamine-hydrolysing)